MKDYREWPMIKLGANSQDTGTVSLQAQSLLCEGVVQRVEPSLSIDSSVTNSHAICPQGCLGGILVAIFGVRVICQKRSRRMISRNSIDESESQLAAR